MVHEFDRELLMRLLEDLYVGADGEGEGAVKLSFPKEFLPDVEEIFDHLFSKFGLKDKKFIYGFTKNGKE